ncbi:MAG: B12-binding domain-containing radical SAM protein, partial [Candidatus Omnitrophica bacterium]|nr:B12-binding domain-containing radical SAM protein [Candidatus Omnitrophota bacterium]
MKVAILNPSFGDNFVRVARWAAKSRGRVQRHPDYLLTAASILLKAGHELIFVEAAARNLSPEVSAKMVREFHPDLLVIHATTPSIYNDIEQARVIKEQNNCQVAFVGQHVSAEPHNTLEIARGAIDYILRGEYDYTLRDLANGLPPVQLPGLTWRSAEGKIIDNPNRPPLDVNELPFPAWQLIQPE